MLANRKKSYQRALQTLCIGISLASVPVMALAEDLGQSFGGYNAAKKSVILPSVMSTPGMDVTKAFEFKGEDQRMLEQLNAAARLDVSKDPAKVMGIYDQIIAAYEQPYKNGKVKLYSARMPTEAMYYAVLASKEGKDAKVISSNLGYAYFQKGYALVDLGREEEAKVQLDHALALSPMNAQFLGEIASYYQRKKDWATELSYHLKEEEAVKNNFSPSNTKNLELGHAWRGQGFVYTETNRLDEAEKMYRKCIELDSNDSRARNELGYIAQLRATGKKAPSVTVGGPYGMIGQ